MKNDGYVITNPDKFKFNKILGKVMQLGDAYYKRLGCDIEIRATEIIFRCDTSKIEPMQLLDFSFAGLYTDEEKVNEIENFGKYECNVSMLSDE